MKSTKISQLKDHVQRIDCVGCKQQAISQTIECIRAGWTDRSMIQLEHTLQQTCICEDVLFTDL